MSSLICKVEKYPLAGAFRISRGSKTEAVVVVVSIHRDGFTGYGECLPYNRYNESTDSVCAQIHSMSELVSDGLDRISLQDKLLPGAARNALDCALIDLEAKQKGIRAWELLQLESPQPCTTAYTLSLDNPETMAMNAKKHSDRGLLKLKLGPDDAADCVREVRKQAPLSELIVDANEAWSIEQLENSIDEFAACKVAMVEQPLPAAADDLLTGRQFPIAIGADESAHTSNELSELVNKYQIVNIKLDKTGGLTEAIKMRKLAQDLNLNCMIGCMIATSLSMAPATLLANQARFVDLDGPLLLAKDRSPSIDYQKDKIYPPDSQLWG